MSSPSLHRFAELADAMSPWRFLEPLQEESEEDRELIEMTRAEELEIIGDMVATSRVSLLYAFSGNGKSSLIHAGLIPAFRRRRGYIVFKTRPRPPWSIQDPIRAFKDCMLRDIELPLIYQSEMKKLRELRSRVTTLDGALSAEIADVLTSLEAKLNRVQVSSPDSTELTSYLRSKMDLTLVQFIGEIQKHLGVETRFLFVCDQFEELFVHYQNSPEADRFVRELGEVWANDSLKVHFLFSMREDWVGSMITFRQAIPEIFASYYRLAPLTYRCAAMVLKGPLEKRGLAWEEGAVSALLSDLARAYSANQSDRFNGINLTPSPAEDPYVELPALQIVANELWSTREENSKPFSLEHYRSLLNHAGEQDGVPDPELSPAQCVLDSYLKRRLAYIPETAEMRETMEELRVECLYALTDRSRHRRALVGSALLEEVRRLRPSALDLGDVQPANLEAAVQPLVENHLITQYEALAGQKQYELAHDFAVRSVVKLWRDLDHKRTVLLALLRRERERKDEQLALATDREKRVLKLLAVAPFVAVVGVIALIAMLIMSIGLHAEQMESLVRVETLAVTGVLAALTGVASVSRRLLASVLLLSAILAVNIASGVEFPFISWAKPLRIGLGRAVPLPAVVRGHSQRQVDLIGIEVASNTTLHFLREGVTDSEIINATDPPDWAEKFLSYERFGYPDLPDKVEVSPGFYWILVRPRSDYYQLRVVSGDGSSKVPKVVALGHLTKPYNFQQGLEILLISSLGILAIGLTIAALRNFVDLQRLAGGSELAIRVGRIMLAESLDITLLLVVAIGLAWAEGLMVTAAQPRFVWPFRMIWLMCSLAAIASGLLKTWALHHWKRTPGMVLAGLGIMGPYEGQPSFKNLAVRELLFLGWSVCNLALGIPCLLLTPFIVRYSRNRQNFYDTWAHTKLIDIEIARAGEYKEEREAVPAT